MRILILGSILVFSTAQASAVQDFRSDFRSQAIGSIEVGQISFSESMRAKADILGRSELARLSSYLREDLERALMQSSWLGISADETHLNVVILDATPNRPTMNQVNQSGGTHNREAVTGGASLSATLVRGGEEIANFTYSWQNDALDQNASYGIWTDARTTFDRFANSIADGLGTAPMPIS
ncbi:MAG: hypothetical protein P8J78_07205 [Maricaulis sp.]|nr:hypothetical protein [Maricaulis sp.]